MSDIIAAARAAWGRIRSNATYDDWIAVARALAIGRAHCMQLAKSNKPEGATYNRAIGQWLQQHGLNGIVAQERYRCLLILDNFGAISKWRAGLDDARRRRLNHPNAIWANWRKATTHETRVRNHAAGNGNCHTQRQGRQVHFSGDTIERGADAMRESRSGDWFVLARKCLEAAIRGEHDLLALLDRKPAVNAPAQIGAMP